MVGDDLGCAVTMQKLTMFSSLRRAAGPESVLPGRVTDVRGLVGAPARRTDRGQSTFPPALGGLHICRHAPRAHRLLLPHTGCRE
ncbi:hypothetical protein CEXT_286101 [Caerostris extrusa]|uniref:Uncharacterized protein n=1 Tax=Caerostris extrusa TaxID=172846 RepID=A0AAV4SP21_CAEEX|nr:hypothetical protein CEXT_286101 [Caerostris extrusa]